MRGTTASRVALAALAAWLALLAGAAVAEAQDPCEDPGNLTFNCQFDTFGAAPGGEVPTGWWPFVISGHPAFDAASDTPKYPALRVWSDGEAFVAGIYQEVTGVEVGATYEAYIGWAVFQSAGDRMGRAIGIDPTGGTDAAADTVVWSTEVWEKRRTNPELVVRAVAQAETITVFVRANNPSSSGADQAFLDAVSLIRDESVPVVSPVQAEPTATPAPVATDTPAVVVPAEPTATLEPTATEVPTETAAPTSTGTSTATATPTDTPSPTATPTPKPSPQVWVLASAAVTMEPTSSFPSVVASETTSLPDSRWLLLVGLGAAVGAVAAAAANRSRSLGARKDDQ